MEKIALKVQAFGELYLLGDFKRIGDNFVRFLKIIVYVEKNYMQGKFVQRELRFIKFVYVGCWEYIIV